MAYPFPGMNPWLENPLMWHSVQLSLSVHLSYDIGARVRPKYFAHIKEHIYPEIEPHSDPIEENYLQVECIETGELVTVIEILSHSNKQRGHDREEYIAKRQQFFDTGVSVIEIDLLRSGPVMPFAEAAKSADYRILVRHRAHPECLKLYPFIVSQPIPIFPLPLLPDDQEPLIDLHPVLAGVYERVGYDLVINYAEPPVPPLREADVARANECLTKLTG